MRPLFLAGGSPGVRGWFTTADTDGDPFAEEGQLILLFLVALLFEEVVVVGVDVAFSLDAESVVLVCHNKSALLSSQRRVFLVGWFMLSVLCSPAGADPCGCWRPPFVELVFLRSYHYGWCWEVCMISRRRNGWLFG